MFNVRPDDIERLRSPGGDRFTRFVNDVILAHAMSSRIVAPDVHLNLQTNIGDGGVDAEVAAGGIDPLGWLVHPSVWQFKATEASNATPALLAQDLNKEYATRRVGEGFVFYACICDQLTQVERSRREDALREAAQKINPDAPEPHVLDANDLASLASGYPGVVLRHLRSQLQGLCLSLDAWRRNAVGSTEHYILPPELENVKARIEDHLTFTTTPSSSVLVLRGESGVGKTRLTFETIYHAASARSLAVYATDDKVVNQLATVFANEPLSAIVVADEMTSKGINRLRAILDGHRDRIRIIAIESTEEEYHRDDGEAIWIGGVSIQTLEEILEANFPEVTRERRRAYVHLSEGAIRFAVELCRRDTEISSDRELPRATFAREYISNLLADDERVAVEVVALVYGVGWRDEVAAELEELADLVQCDIQRVRRGATRIGSGPGFIASAGRYWYVKPPIVAQITFEDAWQRWVAHNERSFLERVAGSGALVPFLRQVGRVASKDVRRRVGHYFGSWAGDLTPNSLRSQHDLSQLLDLIEVDPGMYLSIFRQLVERAPDEVLVNSRSWDPAHAPKEAKHELVRAARRFANLGEHFHDAEAILLRLALAEEAPQTSPNGTSSYKQLFKVILSGSDLPFSSRLSVLSKRIGEEDLASSLLAVDALCAIFDLHHYRGLDEPVIGGHIAADDWQPKTYKEWRQCLVAAVDELRTVINQYSDAIRERAWDGILQRLRELIDKGFANAIGELFPPDQLPSTVRERLVIELNDYLDWFDEAENESTRRGDLSSEDEERLRQLLDEFKPSDIQGRLSLLLSVDYWQAKVLVPGSQWRAEAQAIAIELIQRPSDFANAMDRLFSISTDNVYELALELGRQDTGAALLSAILDASLSRPISYFSQGYIKGLNDTSAAYASRIVQFLDEAEQRDPIIAFYHAPYGEQCSNALDRMIRLVDKGRVPAFHLSKLVNWAMRCQLNEADLERLLDQFVTAAEQGDGSAATSGLKLLSLQAHADGVAFTGMLSRGRFASLVWRIVEAMSTSMFSSDHSWIKVFGTIAPTDSERAAKVAANVLASGNSTFIPVASEVLAELAEKDSEIVMQELGRVILDLEAGFRFSLYSHADVLGKIFLPVVGAWLARNGREGAKALAGHLPHPFLDASGQPKVPTLTESVLNEYGQDKEVLDRFCEAPISGSRIEVEELYEGLAKRKARANEAQAFNTHPNEYIRAWAHGVQEAVARHEEWVHNVQRDSEERRFR